MDDIVSHKHNYNLWRQQNYDIAWTKVADDFFVDESMAEMGR